VAAGRWEERAHYRGDELGGRTLGIVGFGNIGRVSRAGEAFGMRVLVAEHTARTADSGPATPERCSLHALLAMADVVTLHLPLTAATRGLIGAAELACMRPGALLVNTARGSLIDMPALRDALESGRLGGFAADVLDAEPPAADDPLLTRDDVVLTPHVASLTAATYRALCVSTASNVARILRGEAPEVRALFVG
jgi:D-3-phosphoglycerate dehydrogenase